MQKAAILTAAAAIGLAGGLYLSLNTNKSPGVEFAQDYSAVAQQRDGDMLKLQFETRPVSQIAFTSEDGEDLTLAQFQGKFALVNFWATWCAPCRVEMPHLAELQTAFPEEKFEVVTIATGRNPRPAMEEFFNEIGVDSLPLHTDPSGALARDMGVLALPVTVILSPEGYEIARLLGDADWASDSARQIIESLMDAERERS